MIGEDKIIPALREQDIDIIIASTPMHVFYTSGIVTSTTVTPHDENFEETGFYYDTPASPPKNLTIWSVDHGGPYMVLAPNETGQLPYLDAEETVVYAPEGFKKDSEEELSDREEVVRKALQNSQPTIYEALASAVDPLMDDDSHVALEKMSLSSVVYGHIEDRLDCGRISDATPVFHELRLTKTPEEIARLKRAAESTESAILAAVDEITAGMTEREFANIFRIKQAELGCNNRHCHIGFGPNSAHGHVVPGDRVIQEGDLIRFEVGGYYVDDRDLDRQIDPRHTFYPGDLARTYAYREATEKHERQYEVVYSAMEKCRSLLADGVTAASVHHETMDHARRVAQEVGAKELVDWTRRMCGHNIGLDAHDHPLISPDMDRVEHNTLLTNMVMNWELGYMSQGVGGIQLEETGRITDDGVESFTASQDRLPIVG